MHSNRFPNESDQYRQARNELLKEELELRRHVERVAAQRRRLPVGGEVNEDYLFEEGGSTLADETTVRSVRLSELFGDRDTLLVYSFMYGPAMAKACPMCTSLLDGLNGQAAHIRQRAAFAVVAKSPIKRLRGYARERAWDELRLLSSAKNSYNRDYFGESADGSQETMMNVFVRRDGKVLHFYGSELRFEPADAGQNPRHVDMLWPLWNTLDLTPEGRGSDFYPKLSYH